MFNISLISYNRSNYHMVKENNKVKPVSVVSEVSNKNGSNENSNSSGFNEMLEVEIEKQKKKRKRVEE